MNSILSTPFRQILLRVKTMLTPYVEEFRFFSKEILPETHSKMSLLEIFNVLEEQQVISPDNVKHLKDFAVAIGRNEVVELLKLYEMRVCIQKVIEGYLDFRSESRTTNVLETDFLARYLVRSGGSQYSDDIEMALRKNEQDGFPLQVVVNNLIPQKAPVELTWKTVLEILKLCSEIVYVRYLFTRNFKQLMSDIDEIVENVLMKSVVPWMTEHGGLSFVASREVEKKDILLINLLSRGSMDIAKKLFYEKEEVDTQQTNNAPEWCKCRRCKLMPNDQENVCCKKVNCITSYNTFENICLNRDVLEEVIKARCNLRADDFDFSMESFRKAAYRWFALWRYGKLGRGNRRVIPSCAVLKVREIYPSPDGQYMGFKPH